MPRSSLEADVSLTAAEVIARKPIGPDDTEHTPGLEKTPGIAENAPKHEGD